MADLAGRPLLTRLIERVRRARTPDAVILCTSTNTQDDPLEMLGRENGVEVFRGDELDVMGRFLSVARAHEARTIVRVTGDNPLTDPEMMDHMLAIHDEQAAEYTYTDDLPRGTRSEIMDVAALERCYGLIEDRLATEYMTLMIRRPDRFRVIRAGALDDAVRRPELRLTIDTPDDLRLVRGIYEAFDGAPPRLAEIIAWLDARPSLRDVNRGIEPRDIGGTVNVRLRGD